LVGSTKSLEKSQRKHAAFGSGRAHLDRGDAPRLVEHPEKGLI
jgi:hypothetical protein